jgi:hypothetical protein
MRSTLRVVQHCYREQMQTKLKTDTDWPICQPAGPTWTRTPTLHRKFSLSLLCLLLTRAHSLPPTLQHTSARVACMHHRHSIVSCVPGLRSGSDPCPVQVAPISPPFNSRSRQQLHFHASVLAAAAAAEITFLLQPLWKQPLGLLQFAGNFALTLAGSRSLAQQSLEAAGDRDRLPQGNRKQLEIESASKDYSIAPHHHHPTPFSPSHAPEGQSDSAINAVLPPPTHTLTSFIQSPLHTHTPIWEFAPFGYLWISLDMSGYRWI